MKRVGMRKKNAALKGVEPWGGKDASGTPAQAQDIRDIKEGLAELNRTVQGLRSRENLRNQHTQRRHAARSLLATKPKQAARAPNQSPSGTTRNYLSA